MNLESKVTFHLKIPKKVWRPGIDFLLYDNNFLKYQPEYKAWVHQFTNRLGVQGGESLKDFSKFPQLLEKVLKNWKIPIGRQSRIIVLGGGSLGDVGGFLAAILKRGVVLWQVPTTWLAAIDSSHGGKNGLNVAGVKNQVGQFYGAERVLLIREILKKNAKDHFHQASGEIIKMGLIGSSSLFEETLEANIESESFFWKCAPAVIEEKMKVVNRDPYETQGYRVSLNFGHTWGHVLEGLLGRGHGECVLQGILFSLEWGKKQKILGSKATLDLQVKMKEKFSLEAWHQSSSWEKLSSKKVRNLLQADKKLDPQRKIKFIFLKNVGEWTMKLVTLDSIITEARRQGWIK